MAEIQEITTREDLGILLEGDRVSATFENFRGTLVYAGRDRNGLHFVFRDGWRILDYAIPNDDIDVSDGRIHVNRKVKFKELLPDQPRYSRYEMLIEHS